MEKSKLYWEQLEGLEGGEDFLKRVSDLQSLIKNMTITVEEKDMEISALKTINKHL